jgi:hypothetical protein
MNHNSEKPGSDRAGIDKPSIDKPQWTRRQFMYSAAAATALAAVAGSTVIASTSAQATPAPTPGTGGGSVGGSSGSGQPNAAGPYLVGQVAVASGGTATTAIVDVSHATASGDAIVLCPATTGGDTIKQVTDSNGNSYKLVTAEANGSLAGWAYVALNAEPLTTTDTITVTYSGSSAHNVVAVGVPGGAAIDAGGSAAASGDSATPTVTTGTLASASETLVAVSTSGAGPISWSEKPFGPIEVYGGGVVTMVAISEGSKTPGGLMVAGGDVEGYFTTNDSDGAGAYGDQWTPANAGLYEQFWRQCACIAYSDLEENTIYSCAGDPGSADGGGFVVSTDNGATWSRRSADVQFAGNRAAAPLPDSGWPRSTGNLLAQDATNELLYAGTYSGGVFRSGVSSEYKLPGQHWEPIGLTPVVVGGKTYKYYCRSLVMDSDLETIYVATYDYTGDGTYGHVWVTTEAQAAKPGWTSTDLSSAGTGGHVAIGLTVLRDDATPSNQYVLAGVEASGVYLMKNGAAWTRVSSIVGTAKQYTEFMPFASLYGSTYSQYVYALDRDSGVYRGSDYGQTWTSAPIYACDTNSDSRTGFLALNPAVDDELWVSDLSGLFKIGGASTFDNGTPTPVSLPDKMLPGAVAFAADGTVYCLGLGSASHPNTVLFRSVNGGADWADVGGPGPGIAANASQPGNMVIAPNGLIYVGSGGDIVAYGNPAAGWQPQGGDLHTGTGGHTSAASQVVSATAPVTATGQITAGDWLMLVVALQTGP